MDLKYDDNLIRDVIDSLPQEGLSKKQIASVALATIQCIRKQDLWWLDTSLKMVMATLIDDLSEDEPV